MASEVRSGATWDVDGGREVVVSTTTATTTDDVESGLRSGATWDADGGGLVQHGTMPSEVRHGTQTSGSSDGMEWKNSPLASSGDSEFGHPSAGAQLLKYAKKNWKVLAFGVIVMLVFGVTLLVFFIQVSIVASKPSCDAKGADPMNCNSMWDGLFTAVMIIFLLLFCALFAIFFATIAVCQYARPARVLGAPKDAGRIPREATELPIGHTKMVVAQHKDYYRLSGITQKPEKDTAHPPLLNQASANSCKVVRKEVATMAPSACLWATGASTLGWIRKEPVKVQLSLTWDYNRAANSRCGPHPTLENDYYPLPTECSSKCTEGCTGNIMPSSYPADRILKNPGTPQAFNSKPGYGMQFAVQIVESSLEPQKLLGFLKIPVRRAWSVCVNFRRTPTYGTHQPLAYAYIYIYIYHIYIYIYHTHGYMRHSHQPTSPLPLPSRLTSTPAHQSSTSRCRRRTHTSINSATSIKMRERTIARGGTTIALASTLSAKDGVWSKRKRPSPSKAHKPRTSPSRATIVPLRRSGKTHWSRVVKSRRVTLRRHRCHGFHRRRRDGSRTL